MAKSAAKISGQRRWRTALWRALERASELDQTRSALEKSLETLDRVADNVVRLGLDGDWDAINEIGNRLDGKVTQQVDLGGVDGEGAPVSLSVVLVKAQQVLDEGIRQMVDAEMEKASEQ